MSMLHINQIVGNKISPLPLLPSMSLKRKWIHFKPSKLTKCAKPTTTLLLPYHF